MSLRLRESFGASVNAPSNFEKKAADIPVAVNENHEVQSAIPKLFEIQTDNFNDILGEPKKTQKSVKKAPAKHGSLPKQAMGLFESQHYPEFHSEELLNGENGVKALPYPIDFMESSELSYDQSLIAVKIGIKSMDKDGVPVLVIKTSNSYTIYKKNEENISLVWAMDGIELVKKVKAKDGLVYIDILVTDDFDSKKIRVPLSVFDNKSIKNLQKYGVKISPMYCFEMAIYLQKIANRMPMEDASQLIGVLRDSSSDFGFKFNGYTS